MEEIEKLIQYYENACNAYIKVFAEKQGLQFDFWIGDEVGGIASFGQGYYFNINDIVYDVNNKCEKGLILKWHDDMVEAGYEKAINYSSYSKGVRV